EGPNEGLLDVADVAMEVTPVGLEVEDRVSYELTRPVIGHIAPASGLEARNAHEPALGLVGQYVLRIRGRAQRDDVRVLAGQELVRDPAGPALADQGLLLAEGFPVVDRPQPARVQRPTVVPGFGRRGRRPAPCPSPLA